MRCRLLFLGILLPFVAAAQTDTLELQTERITILTTPAPTEYTLAVDSLGRLPIAGLRLNNALIAFPGLALNDYGGHGSLQTLSVRGMGSQHTGVSINGVPVEDAQTGSVDLGNLYLNGLTGISFQQTPMGGLQAPTTGLLNLQSEPQGDLWQVRAGAGSYGEWLGSIGKSITRDSTKARFDAQYLHSREDYPFNLNGETGTRSASNPRIFTGQALVRHQLDARKSIEYFARGGYKQLRIPPAVVTGNLNAPPAELQQGDVWQYLKLDLPSAGAGSRSPLIVRHSYQDLQYQDRIDTSRYQLHQLLASLAFPVYSKRLKQGSMSVSGIGQYRLLHLRSDQLFVGVGDTSNRVQRHQGDLGMLGSLYLGRWQVKLSVRGAWANEQEPFLPSASARVQYEWALRERWQLQPFVYTAYSGRYPSFNELYFFGFGNPELPPEKRWQTSGGVALSRGRAFTLRVSGYHTRTVDRIIAVPLSPVRWSTRSFGLTKTTGAELAFNYTPLKWLPLMASASYQQAREFALTDGNRLPYISDWTVKAGLLPTWKGIQLGTQLQAFGVRYPDVANRPQQQLPSVWLLDAWLQWRHDFGPIVVESRLSCENLTNELYVLVNNFPMPARRWRLQLSLVF